MGRFSGYWWSPDSKLIAYEEADHTASRRGTSPTRSKPDAEAAAAVLPAAGQEERERAARHRAGRPAARRSGSTGTAKKYEYLAAVQLGQARPADDPGAGPQAAGDGAAACRSRDGQDDETARREGSGVHEPAPGHAALAAGRRRSSSGSASTARDQVWNCGGADGSLLGHGRPLRTRG